MPKITNGYINIYRANRKVISIMYCSDVVNSRYMNRLFIYPYYDAISL